MATGASGDYLSKQLHQAKDCRNKREGNTVASDRLQTHIDLFQDSCKLQPAVVHLIGRPEYLNIIDSFENMIPAPQWKLATAMGVMLWRFGEVRDLVLRGATHADCLEPEDELVRVSCLCGPEGAALDMKNPSCAPIAIGMGPINSSS